MEALDIVSRWSVSGWQNEKFRPRVLQLLNSIGEILQII